VLNIQKNFSNSQHNPYYPKIFYIYRTSRLRPNNNVRRNALKKSNEMRQYADIYLLLHYSTCFRRPSRPSSGVHKTVVAASGTDHTIWEPASSNATQGARIYSAPQKVVADSWRNIKKNCWLFWEFAISEIGSQLWFRNLCAKYWESHIWFWSRLDFVTEF